MFRPKSTHSKISTPSYDDDGRDGRKKSHKRRYPEPPAPLAMKNSRHDSSDVELSDSDHQLSRNPSEDYVNHSTQVAQLPNSHNNGSIIDGEDLFGTGHLQSQNLILGPASRESTVGQRPTSDSLISCSPSRSRSQCRSQRSRSQDSDDTAESYCPTPKRMSRVVRQSQHQSQTLDIMSRSRNSKECSRSRDPLPRAMHDLVQRQSSRRSSCDDVMSVSRPSCCDRTEEEQSPNCIAPRSHCSSTSAGTVVTGGRLLSSERILELSDRVASCTNKVHQSGLQKQTVTPCSRTTDEIVNSGRQSSSFTPLSDRPINVASCPIARTSLPSGNLKQILFYHLIVLGD